jgi:hypothetical protein
MHIFRILPVRAINILMVLTDAGMNGTGCVQRA